MNNSETKYYKAFDKNLKCRDMQYEIGKEYTFDGDPIPCEQGFHFCKSIVDCYMFYNKSEDTRICEVLPLGKVVTDDKVKYCTNKIKIIKEIENPRAKTNISETSSGYCNSGCCNTGDCNSGYSNTGDWNSGNRNTGNWNTGDLNSGNRNTGDWNTGDLNSGNCNSGNQNTGYCNSGYYNTGNWNKGNWNSGDGNSGNCNSGNYNSGVFNTNKNPKIKMFDQESNWTITDWLTSEAYGIMLECPYFVKPPENLIVIDFDLKNDKGEKDLEKNLKAASKWPPTYTELSKSRYGIHLRNKADDIEIKIFEADKNTAKQESKSNIYQYFEEEKEMRYTYEQMDMKPKLYLSGPMAGRDWKDVTKEFKKYEELFKTLGFDVMNPCKFDHTNTEDRELTLKEDFKQLEKADFIFMMPGWEEAKGCNAEWGYALACGIKVLKSNNPIRLGTALRDLINYLYDSFGTFEGDGEVDTKN